MSDLGTSTNVEDTLADTRSSAQRDELGARVGEKIGRYLVIHPIGAGAMGVVYGAYDPELDRKVALKLLHAGPSDDIKLQARLLREAQAMARLSHPQVVTVHDVGTHKGQIFVAMEFVEGRTLDAWRGEQRRSWPEVLSVFEHAGEGLAAAHAAGLVHRDFKPENVLVSHEGQIRVVDFGLVQSTGDTRSDLSDSGVDLFDSSPSLIESIDIDLTRTGAMLGTPAYMSPEQFSRLPLDARSDQFSFCASLYETLYNQRPFAAPSLPGLATAVLEGKLSPPPPDSEVPDWLHRAIVRGLSTDPNARWPSMNALLDALARGQRAAGPGSATTRRTAFLAAGLAAAVALAWSTREDETPTADACADAGEAMQALWTPARAEAIRAGLTAASPAFGDESAAAVRAELDAYAEAWIATRRAACEATQRGVQSEALLDLRMICLDRRLAGVDAVASALAEANFDVASRAMELVTALEPLAPCSDAEALRRRPGLELDAHERESVERSYELLTRGNMATRAADYDEAQTLAEQALERSAAVSGHPVHARALLLRGQIELARGANEAAEASFDRAAEAALRCGDPEALASVLIAQGNLLGFGLARPAEGERLLAYAHATLSRGVDSPALEAELANARGLIAYTRGDTDSAIALFERVLELRAEQWGPDHPQTANILNNLGAVAFAKGDNAASRRYHERTLKIWRAAYGPDHPDVAVSLNNLATLADLERDYPRAESLYREALALRERLLGPDHPDVATAYANLGICLEGAERSREAIAAHRRALDIFEASFGPEHPRLASPLTGIARSLLALGSPEQLAEAQPLAERSLAIRSAAQVPPYDLAQSNIALAKILIARGSDRVRAIELAFAARALLVEVEGVDAEFDELDAWLEAVSAGG